MSPDELLRVLADPERLAVAGAIAAGPLTATELRGMLGLPAKRLQQHRAKLTAAGIVVVEADRRTYRLDPETLRRAAQEVAPPRDPGLALGTVFADEEAILRHYFRGGRLREIPIRRAKRLVILNLVALEFPAQHGAARIGDVPRLCPPPPRQDGAGWEADQMRT